MDETWGRFNLNTKVMIIGRCGWVTFPADSTGERLHGLTASRAFLKSYRDYDEDDKNSVNKYTWRVGVHNWTLLEEP